MLISSEERIVSICSVLLIYWSYNTRVLNTCISNNARRVYAYEQSEIPSMRLKVLTDYSNWGAIRSDAINRSVGYFFLFNCKGTPSQGEQKTIFTSANDSYMILIG
jgi:hypothetical protein